MAEQMMHSTGAQYDETATDEYENHRGVVHASRETAERVAFAQARAAGAPGQARVCWEYDVYMVDIVRVQWVTPVFDEQPRDLTGLDPRFKDGGILKPKVVISKRLGNMPR